MHARANPYEEAAQQQRANTKNFRSTTAVLLPKCTFDQPCPAAVFFAIPRNARCTRCLGKPGTVGLFSAQEQQREARGFVGSRQQQAQPQDLAQTRPPPQTTGPNFPATSSGNKTAGRERSSARILACAQTMVTASHWVGFTLPGMIDEPAPSPRKTQTSKGGRERRKNKVRKRGYQ